MFKKILSFCLFISLILLCSVDCTFFYGQTVTVAENSSVGGFYSSAAYNLSQAFSGDGVSKSFNVNYDYQNEIILKYGAKLVKTDATGGVINLYFYSYKLPKSVYIASEKINVHVAISNEKLTVGYPIIYSGY